MAVPIRTQILNNVIATLKGISESAGYPIDVKHVERGVSVPTENAEFPLIVVIDSREDKQINDVSHFTLCTLHIEVVGWGLSMDTLLDKAVDLGTSIEKALGVDINRGGLAIDTRPISNDLLIAEEVSLYGGIRVLIDILYRHRSNNPFVQ